MSDTTTGTPPLIGRRLSAAEFAAYVATYQFNAIRPDCIVLHHTYRPDQRQWAGLRSMQGMQAHYRGLGWSSAPHLYIAADGIWLFTPLRNVGVHAGSANSTTVNGQLVAYSIGVEMVWNGETSQPSGPTLDNTVSALATLCKMLGKTPEQAISFHRDHKETSCPGRFVTKDWIFPLVRQALALPSPSDPTIHLTISSPIVSKPRCTVAQAISIFRRNAKYENYTQADIETVIIPNYFGIAERVGVDPCLAIAQMIHETGYLSSWWSARPRRNPAGIGVTGDVSPSKPRIGSWALRDGQWLEGVSFDSWAGHAIPAHVGRLLAYATYPERRSADQTALVRTALAYRHLPGERHGAAQTIDSLRGTWAVPGTNYPQKLLEIMNAMRSM